MADGKMSCPTARRGICDETDSFHETSTHEVKQFRQGVFCVTQAYYYVTKYEYKPQGKIFS